MSWVDICQRCPWCGSKPVLEIVDHTGTKVNSSIHFRLTWMPQTTKRIRCATRSCPEKPSVTSNKAGNAVNQWNELKGKSE